MKGKGSFWLSFFAVLSPFTGIMIMCRIEKEFAEALMAGILVGSVIGSMLGLLAIILNKQKSKIIYVLSILPMCMVAIYVMLFFTRLLYR